MIANMVLLFICNQHSWHVNCISALPCRSTAFRSNVILVRVTESGRPIAGWDVFGLFFGFKCCVVRPQEKIALLKLVAKMYNTVVSSSTPQPVLSDAVVEATLDCLKSDGRKEADLRNAALDVAMAMFDRYKRLEAGLAGELKPLVEAAQDDDDPFVQKNAKDLLAKMAQ